MSKQNKKSKRAELNNANTNPMPTAKEEVTGNGTFGIPTDIAAEPFRSCPETAEEMVNTYGTYNIQPTANSVNDYPAIAQGETKNMKERPLGFFRGADDPNPAADMSDSDCT